MNIEDSWDSSHGRDCEVLELIILGNRYKHNLSDCIVNKYKKCSLSLYSHPHYCLLMNLLAFTAHHLTCKVNEHVNTDFNIPALDMGMEWIFHWSKGYSYEQTPLSSILTLTPRFRSVQQ